MQRHELAKLDLVNELNVSRTQAREALIKLASAGSIKLDFNCAALVSDVTLSNFREFFEAFEVAQR